MGEEKGERERGREGEREREGDNQIRCRQPKIEKLSESTNLETQWVLGEREREREREVTTRIKENKIASQ